MMPFRSIIFTAINNGWLQRDPFYAYHITKEETKRGYLTKEEITQMINCTFKRKNYELIRDLFIFCCFTGLSWRDMANLTEENLQVSFDGHLWIKTSRQKTGVETNIRLLDKAKNETLEREIPQLQEIAGKTWKKEDELKQLKSELAALDRKIQLELAPKHEETTSQGQEQGGGQDLPKAENVPKPDDAARDYIRDHIIIGRPGISERREGHGRKM